ncbi:MAG: Gfo/Idh/MocA family oxidoreductase [Pseudomonadota bacterium]
MQVVLAGVGAFGRKHLDSLRQIDGVHVACVVDPEVDAAQKAADQYGVPRVSTDLGDALALPDIDAAILATPTPFHAKQAIQCLDAGKHVLIEIPLADSLEDAEKVLVRQKATGLVAMCGHTRRFNPSHQWIQQRIASGDLTIQQMDVQTFFFRRSNLNADGEPRSWTDHLLWHHAAHTVDLFAYQANEEIQTINALQGPRHPELGIAMDMSIQMQTASGKICTLSLSFNNEGPLGTVFRYICDNGTFVARYDDLVSGYEESIDVSDVAATMNGIELQDREFFAAIVERREPNSSVADLIACYRVLHEVEQQLGKDR